MKCSLKLALGVAGAWFLTMSLDAGEVGQRTPLNVLLIYADDIPRAQPASSYPGN